jgi:hypothetical protein
MTRSEIPQKKAIQNRHFAVLDCFAVRACGPGTGLARRALPVDAVMMQRCDDAAGGQAMMVPALGPHHVATASFAR